MGLSPRPLAYCKRLISKTLANSGSRLAPIYLRISGNLVESELRWINQRSVGENDFRELMSIYPALQRILFIHIPKCGGTSIRKTLIQEYGCAPIPLRDVGTISQSIEYMMGSLPPKSSQGQLLAACAKERKSENLRQRFMRVFLGYGLAHSSKKVFMLGHKRARELTSFRRNSNDITLATVRSPADILKSLASYRVSHTLKNAQRTDSIKLLESLQLDLQGFTELVSTQPRHLTERILEKESPSLANYLAVDRHTDHASVWGGIRDQTIFIAHMSEQAQMLGKLFGKQNNQYRMNTSDNRQGLAAEFSGRIQKSWTESFVDADSIKLYQRLESSGVIGFWKNGGTIDEYRELLKTS